MQKWEYCAIVRVISAAVYGKASKRKSDFLAPGGWAALEFFSSQDPKINKLPSDDEISLSQTIASLGEQGWEMVGCGNLRDSHAIYFKRLLIQ